MIGSNASKLCLSMPYEDEQPSGSVEYRDYNVDNQ